MAIGAQGNVKWVDGLRGVASALVVIKHLTAAWFPNLMWPAPSAEASPNLLQLPYFRVLVQGRIGVAIFGFVTGYVCALKPVKLFNEGNHSQGFASMNRSAIRRVPRLLLPCTLIVLLSCIATQLGAFETAKHCDGFGLPQTSPNRRGNILAAMGAMFKDLLRVWTEGYSEYGSELWTMMPILRGAFWIYLYLLTTAHVQQRWRMAIAIVLMLFRLACNDAFLGMQFFFGAFMADLQNLEPGTFTRLQSTSSLPFLRRIMSILLLVTGLFIASLPRDHFDWQGWSLTLHDMLAAVIPSDPDFPRFVSRFASGVGLDFIVIGLHLSPWARDVLSNRFFLFLGRMSFAVYLLHNQILRSIMCWALYGFSMPPEGESLKFSRTRLFILMPCYLVLTYGAAYLWTNYVDSWCARLSERLVNFFKEEKDEKSDSTQLTPLTRLPY